MMSTFHLLKDGYTMVTKGAVDVLIKRTKYIRKNGEVLPINENDIKNINEMNLCLLYTSFNQSSYQKN